MNKIEALKYICDNYHGSDGGFQFACLVEVIQEDKELYTLITNVIIPIVTFSTIYVRCSGFSYCDKLVVWVKTLLI